MTQQHTYFGGFVLALPLFCALLEFLGLVTKKPALALRYDGLARDLAKVAVLALSVTALIGSVMLTMFITLYPSFMKYMGGTFKGFMPVYAAVFVGESLLLIVYYYGWNRMTERGMKWIHAAIGILTNIVGTALLMMVNAWSAFMMSPAGVDAQGRFLGNAWHLLHSALWNPRTSIDSWLTLCPAGGGALCLVSVYQQDRRGASLFRLGRACLLFVTVCAHTHAHCRLLADEVGVHVSPDHGCDDDGWVAHWLFVVRHFDRCLISGDQLLPLAVWPNQRGERYQSYYQLLLGVLMLALFIWLNHTSC